METIKNYWKQILGAIAAVLGILLYARNKEVEGELETAKTDKEGAVLETKREAIKQNETDAEQAKTAAATQRTADKAAASNQSVSQVTDFYKKKLND